MPAKQFTILPPLEFIADVTAEFRQAKKRIYLQAMEVEPGQITNHLLDLLVVGADKQLDARLHVDYYSLLVQDGMFNYLPLLSPKKAERRKKRIGKRIAYFTALREKGVKLTFTNPPSFPAKLFPVMGRNHIKIAIVDDVAWIGGINFHDENFKSIDSMVKLTDPTLVAEIVRLYLDIENRKILSDQKIHITDQTSLLIDGGKRGKSVILTEAIKLINNAQSSVRVITPIIPDTKLARALFSADKAGKKVEVISPHVKTLGGVYKPLVLVNSIIFSLHPNRVPIHFKNRPIHAKILLVDEKHVLLGSHNLTTRGVAIGTQELAVVSSDPYFANQASLFLDHISRLE